MSQYSGYKVQLILKDGSKVKGLISQVVDKKIHLDTAGPANKDKQKTTIVKGNEIKDLIVLELPGSNKQKNGKKTKKQKDLLPSSMSQTVSRSNGISTEYRHEDYEEFSALNSGNVTPAQRALGTDRNNSPRPGSTQCKKNKGKRKEEVDWEEANHELPEFDFASNLAKFDKNSVFAELSQSDSIDPSQRLVGHNKNSTVSTPIATPSAASQERPKTNYDTNEMVKASSNWQENWDQIKVDDQNAIARLTQQLQEKQAEKDLIEEAQERQATWNARDQPSRMSTSTPTNSGAFTIVKDGETDKLPLASPINLLEIERLSHDEYGFGASLLVENAAHGLSSVIANIFGTTQTSRLSSNTRFHVNSPPLVALLVGNNRSGAKVLAAGRHLSNRGLRVIALSIANCDGDDELLSTVEEQMNLFQKFGGKTVHTLSQLENLLSKIDSPLELICDGLQGFDTNISDLIDSELVKAISVIQWANKQSCHKLSIDIPSGLDSGSGHIVDTENACFIESKFIVSMGLPLSAIVHAYTYGYISDNVHFLIDTGVSKKLYQKGSLRKFDKNWFGNGAIVRLNVNARLG